VKKDHHKCTAAAELPEGSGLCKAHELALHKFLTPWSPFETRTVDASTAISCNESNDEITERVHKNI